MSATITVIERATVARINEEHQACQRAYGDALAHALEAGRLLSEVKMQLRHGEFGLWLGEHFEGSDRTARTYMQLAAAPEQERQRVADLSLRQARDEIAKPKRVTASDAGALLQGLGGQPADGLLPARIDQARDRLRDQAPTDAWTEPERRKLGRATGMLDAGLSKLDDASKTESLSRYSIGETIREAVNETRRAAALLEELAFSFER